MIEALVAALRTESAGMQSIPMDWRDIADTLWLATRSSPQRSSEHGSAEEHPDNSVAPVSPPIEDLDSAMPIEATPDPDVARPLPLPDTLGSRGTPTPTQLAVLGRTGMGPDTRPTGHAPLVFRADPYDVLPGQLTLARALRPLKDRRRSNHKQVIDVDATVEHYCGTESLIPIFTLGTDRWFRQAVVVVDTSPTMVVWEEAIDAFARILGKEGAFERVTRWRIDEDSDDVALFDRTGHRYRPAHLADIAATTLILVLSDCVSEMWRSESIWAALDLWGRHGPAAVVQMLPPRLWPATALGTGLISLSAQRRGDPNRLLRVRRSWWMDDDPAPCVGTPVVTFDDNSLSRWARMVMTRGEVTVPGVLTSRNTLRTRAVDVATRRSDARALVDVFRSNASRQASRLATLLSAIAVDLPVARLILNRLVPGGQQVHLAELLASGLLVPDDSRQSHAFAFVAGVRELLQESIGASDALRVWRTIAPHLESTHGPGTFALLFDHPRQSVDDDTEAGTYVIATALATRLGITAPRPVHDQIPPETIGARPTAPPPIEPPAVVPVVPDGTIVVVPDLEAHDLDDDCHEALAKGLRAIGAGELAQRIVNGRKTSRDRPGALHISIVHYKGVISGVEPSGQRQNDAANPLIFEWVDRARDVVTKNDRRTLDLMLNQLSRYLTDARIRDRIAERVTAAVGPSTRVVFGHGLGAVIAYQVMASLRVPVTLVTVGSPFASPRFRELLHQILPREFDSLTPPITWHDIAVPLDPNTWTPLRDRDRDRPSARTETQTTSAVDSPLTHTLASRSGATHMTGYLSSGTAATIILGTCADSSPPLLNHIEDERDRRSLYAGLGRARLMRFEVSNRRVDVDTGVEFFEAAAAAASEDELPEALTDLAFALRSRFDSGEARSDLERVVTCLRRSLALASSSSIAARRSLLADALRCRAALFDDDNDFREAYQLARVALADTDYRDASWPERSTVLARILLHEYAQRDHNGALNEAIELYQRAIEATQSSTSRRDDLLSELAAAHLTRFGATRSAVDLDRSIEYLTAALSNSTPNHPKHFERLELCVHAYSVRYDFFASPNDLEQAITLARGVVASPAIDRQEHAKWLTNLASLLAVRMAAASGNSSALINAAADPIALLHNVIEDESVTADRRFRAAITGGRLAVATHNEAMAADLYSSAVSLLPQVTAAGSPPTLTVFNEVRQAIADAGALALRDYRVPPPKRPLNAVQLLEFGYATLHNVALATNYAATVLARQHPATARRFSRWQSQLNTVGIGGNRTHIEDKLSELVDSIRTLSGFEDFGRMPSGAHLHKCVEHGPAIAFNVSDYGSTAVIVTKRDVRTVPLPLLTPAAVLEQIDRFATASRDPRVTSSRSEQGISETLNWLWDCAVRPVLENLRFARTGPARSALPRVWWVRSGLLGGLPLHAAGDHARRGHNALDCIVSSYIPSIDVLGIAHRDAARPQRAWALRSIVVSTQSDSSDTQTASPDLETHAILRCLPGSRLIEVDTPRAHDVSGLESTATSSAQAHVLPDLEAAMIAHFTGRTAPDARRLLDHFADVEHPLSEYNGGPRLAYLSGSVATVGDDRTTSPASLPPYFGFLLAGFPYVVAGLWDTDDRTSAELASSFYSALDRGDGDFDVRRSARALHQAVLDMRAEQPTIPSRWAAYAHFGA